jgi:hypothetical protein
MKSFPESPYHETEGSVATNAAKQAPNFARRRKLNPY